ncbi:hypothetical protein HA466_0136500 [Hirschfeldia incana]|nr:hypothetical protein HA466_0136500 [Hirschfeldia incana]
MEAAARPPPSSSSSSSTHPSPYASHISSLCPSRRPPPPFIAVLILPFTIASSSINCIDQALSLLLLLAGLHPRVCLLSFSASLLLRLHHRFSRFAQAFTKICYKISKKNLTGIKTT